MIEFLRLIANSVQTATSNSTHGPNKKNDVVEVGSGSCILGNRHETLFWRAIRQFSGMEHASSRHSLQVECWFLDSSLTAKRGIWIKRTSLFRGRKTYLVRYYPNTSFCGKRRIWPDFGNTACDFSTHFANRVLVLRHQSTHGSYGSNEHELSGARRCM